MSVRRRARPGYGVSGPGPGRRWATEETPVVDHAIRPGSAAVMEATALEELFASLRDAGYTVIGPTVRDGAIVLAELPAASDLPFGWESSSNPGATGSGSVPTAPRSGTPPGPSPGSGSCIRPGRGCGQPAWPAAASRSARTRTRSRRGWRSSASGRVTCAPSVSRIRFSAAGTATHGTRPAGKPS